MIKKFPKILYFLLCFTLIFEQSGFAQVAGQLDISGYFGGLHKALTQDKFRPLHLRSIGYSGKGNDLKLILDKGDFKNPPSGELQSTTKDLLNFFFVGITLPNDSFWVNLRPDSPDNIIDDYLAQTDLGKVLLEADLQLKKDTASFTSPQTPEGRDYWNKLYQKANELFAGENVSIPTLTRPWIVPGEIIIRQGTDNAYIYKATLKVMLEQDYLKGSAIYNFNDERLKQLNEYASGLIRKNILPKLTRDVNTAKRYAPLRQVYYSLILAQWFKQKFSGKNGPYSHLINKRDLNGFTSSHPWSKDTYFQAYKKSFQEGEYNIKEPVYTPQGQVIRSYLSGGISFGAEVSGAISQGQIYSTKGLAGGLLKNNIVLDYSGGEFKIDNLLVDPAQDQTAVPPVSSSSPVTDYKEFINTPEATLALAADSRDQVIKELKRLADQVTRNYSEDDFHENAGLIIGTKEANTYRINRLRPLTEFEDGTVADYIIPSSAEVIRVIETELRDGEQVLGDYHNHSFERLRSNQRPGPSSADAMGGGYLNIPGYEDRIVSDRLGMVIEPELNLDKVTMNELANFSPANSEVIVYPYIMPNRGYERRIIPINNIYLKDVIDRVSAEAAGSSSAISSEPSEEIIDRNDVQVIGDAFKKMSGLIKSRKGYIDRWLNSLERLQRNPVSGETRPAERYFALLNGVAGAVKKASGYNDYDTLLYPCSGADISGALSFFDLENKSPRKYSVVTIDRSNIFAGTVSENQVETEVSQYILSKLGTGISFGPYRQYLIDYLLDLVLLSRRFDPQGDNLDALMDSLRLVDYKKEKDAIITAVTFNINGHTIRHTHIAYFMKNRFDEQNEADKLVKDSLKRIIDQGGRTILLSKAHGMLLSEEDVSTELIYPLLKSGTVVVTDDLFEGRKLSLSKTRGELIDLKTAEVSDDLALMQKDTPSLSTNLSNLYWGYARDLAHQLGIFKFEKRPTIQEIAENFKSNHEPLSEVDELVVINKRKELKFRLDDLKELGSNSDLGTDAMAIALLEECGVNSSNADTPATLNEAYLAKATIFKDLRHDLKHELVIFSFADLLSEEVDDFSDYADILKEVPAVAQENNVLVRVLGWEGLLGLDPQILSKIYDRILTHIKKALSLKLQIDALVIRGGFAEAYSIRNQYLLASKNIEQEIKLFISTFARLKNEINEPGIKKPVDINSSLKEIVDMYVSRGSSYEYDLQLDDNVSSLAVSGNELQLSCVWKNLISNAQDAGGRKISFTSGVVEKGGNKFVRMTCTDNGRAIPQEFLADRRLFREGESSKSKDGGTGLYLVDQIIKYHGGDIEAYSGESGPKFVIDFPVEESSSSPVNTTEEFLIELEIDAVASLISSGLARGNPAAIPELLGAYMGGITTALAKYQDAGLDFNKLLNRLSAAMLAKGVAGERIIQLNQLLRQQQAIIEKLATEEKQIRDSVTAANAKLAQKVEELTSKGKEIVIHGTTIDNFLGMLASGRMIQGEINNLGKGNYFEIAKSGDSYAISPDRTEVLLLFDKDAFIKDHGLVSGKDFIIRNHVRDGVVTGYDFFVIRMDLPMRGEDLKYFKLIAPGGIINLGDAVSSSSPLGDSGYSVHAASLETMLDFIKVYPIGISADSLLTGKILNIGMETNSFTGELRNENITTYLSAQGKDITGLDPHPGLTQKFAGRGEFVPGVVQDMPFKDNEFDTVISIGLFNPEMFDLAEMQKNGSSNLIDFYNRAAKEIKRVLKDGGAALISTGPATDSSTFTEVFTSAGFVIHAMPFNNFVMINAKSSSPVDETSGAQAPGLPAKITQQIEGAGGRISYADFMQTALYDNDYGYYARFVNITRDFDTDSEHAEFGNAMASQLLDMWSIMGEPSDFRIVEMGAGRGTLAKNILEYLSKEPRAKDLYKNLKYIIVDVSEHLKAIQAKSVETFPDKVEWKDLEGIEGIQGVFISNELVDAFPVHIIRKQDGQFREVFVSLKDGSFMEELGELSTQEMKDYVQGLTSVDEGQEVPFSPYLSVWSKQVARALKRGFVITADYGVLDAKDYATHENIIWSAKGDTLRDARKQIYKQISSGRSIDITWLINFADLSGNGQGNGLNEISLFSLRDSDFSPAYRTTEVAKYLAVSPDFRMLMQEKGVFSPAASSPLSNDGETSLIEVFTEAPHKDLIDRLRKAAVNTGRNFDADNITKDGYALIDIWQSSAVMLDKFLKELDEIDTLTQKNSPDMQKQLQPVIRGLRDYVEFSRKRGPYAEGELSSSPAVDTQMIESLRKLDGLQV